MLNNFRFHHIGVAVKDIVSTATMYVNGGYKQSDTTFDPVQNVNICWLTKEGMPLLRYRTKDLYTLLKNGVTPYHTCYTVENIEIAIKDLRAQKYIIVSKPQPAVAINNCKVAFLYHKNTGLIELVEAPANI